MQTLEAAAALAPERVAASSGRGARVAVLAGATALVLLGIVLSIALGVREVAIGEAWRALTDPVAGNVDHGVIRGQRVPRTVIALLAGVALALAGVLAQGVTRNPLADPGLLGLNAGASLGIVVAATAFGVLSPLGAIWFAFAGAAVAAVVVFAVGHGRPVQLALAGATVTALISPITTLVLFRDVDAVNSLRYWAVGALTGRDADAVSVLWPFVVFGAVLAFFLAHRLNGLALGDDVASALGQGVGTTRALAAVAIICLAGAATALAGPIALVGLAVPHAARRLVGTDYRWVVPLCALLGPVMLMAADIIGRLVKSDELEAGVVAAIIGAPVLIAVARGRRVAGL
ncbi:iron complex transport system permease protein [Nocardioides sp. J9]|uniref:FecCD family ABC transporter permease n=1 Tax=unclassified Nocardioides TaxID=2615069 RepID=UPI00056502AF|nr:MULTISPECIES: iron chelate uptake ABC transporter family permease subunit [unclassified Nocardioides]TWH01481.1 iron complex transport system permease protein [Nocardioides sp. J9]